MANEYDKILRENFREPKGNLLRMLLREETVSIRPLVPKVQQTIFERETDTLAEITTANEQQFIVHIEWQSTNDMQMANRMALYDLMLYQAHQKEVMGIVLYVGNDKMRMNDSLHFFEFHYSCQIIDVRQLDPEIFLQSDEPGEVIFAILAGLGGDEQKTAIIQRIFSKLQFVFANDPATLKIKIKQLEFLSLLRGRTIQQKVIEEEQNMPVIIDIKEDMRYQQGIEQGIEQGKIETAVKMLTNGIDISLVQNITGLEINKLQELIKSMNSE